MKKTFDFLLRIVFIFYFIQASMLQAEELQEVPFTNFSCDKTSFTLTINLYDLRFKLIGKNLTIELPERELPLKILKLKNNYIIFSRHLFSGRNSAFLTNHQGSELKPLKLPSTMDEFIFLQAQTCDDDVVCIFYNIRSCENFLFLIKEGPEGYFFDERFVREVSFNVKHISDHTLSIKTFKSKLKDFNKEEAYFIAGNVIFIYRSLIQPTVIKRELSSTLDLIELQYDDGKFYGLFKDISWESLPISSEIVYKVYDLINQSLVKSFAAEESLSNSSYVNKNKYMDAIIHDLSHIEPSGILNLGVNNREGLTVWSQVYYLNGLINILAFIEQLDFTKDFREKIRQRLDIEMYLLDQMIVEDERNLLTQRYSVERVPIICSLHYARILRVMRRYTSLIKNPIALKSLPLIIKRTLLLDRPENFDQLVSANKNMPGLSEGQMYVTFKKGAAFPHDGINNPYNYMTQWIGEIQYYINEREQSPQKRAIIDIAKLFFQNEKFHDNHFPKDFQWCYNWGWGKKGRTLKENLSINLPFYPPDPGIAHISYRTIDVIGLLSIVNKFPYIIPRGFVDYVANAVENNGVWPFAYEELFNFGKPIKLHSNVAWWYLRCNSAYQIENASIALLYFLGDKKI